MGVREGRSEDAVRHIQQCNGSERREESGDG